MTNNKFDNMENVVWNNVSIIKDRVIHLITNYCSGIPLHIIRDYLGTIRNNPSMLKRTTRYNIYIDTKKLM